MKSSAAYSLGCYLYYYIIFIIYIYYIYIIYLYYIILLYIVAYLFCWVCFVEVYY